MTDADKIELVVAEWSGPALAARHELEAWIEANGWDGELVVHDHDTTDLVRDDRVAPTFQGWGECRLNGGPWMRVSELLGTLKGFPKISTWGDPDDPEGHLIAIVCSSREEAEKVLRDHQAMEALQDRVHFSQKGGWFRAWTDPDESFDVDAPDAEGGDPADVILAAKGKAK